MRPPDAVDHGHLHLDARTYLEVTRRLVPCYDRLQEAVAAASEGSAVRTLLDLGAGTGETLGAVLARHQGATALGLDREEAVLEVARTRLRGLRVDLRVAELSAPLPDGPFDLVTSALAVHHLEGTAKAALFCQVARVLRPGGRFVLGDVVIPDDPADAVTCVSGAHDRAVTVDELLRWLAEAGLVPAVAWAERDLVVVRAERPLSWEAP
ncbi:MAG TPA: class I SAM-dependent methyltransferase [Acidimicrobiales bacterium]|nr:class I SAM-dependent methyltransferase [Acidimicrobiales bacterium]